MYQNTGVDQLCSYRTADLRLCFHNYIVYSMQKATFLMTQLVKFSNFKRKKYMIQYEYSVTLVF